MTDYKDIDVLSLMMDLHKIAQVPRQLTADKIHALALQYLDNLIDPAKSIASASGIGLKASDLDNMTSLLNYVKANNIMSYNKPIIEEEEDMSDNPAYVYYDGAYINKTGLKNYLDHLHFAMANDVINRPLLDKLIAEVNTTFPDLGYQPAKQHASNKDEQSKERQALPATTVQPQAQNATKSITDMPLPLDYTNIDFSRIAHWMNAVAQLPTMVNRYQELFRRINDSINTLAGMSGTGMAPIELTTKVDAIYTNVRDNARGVAQSAGQPVIASNMAGAFLRELMVFMNNIKNVISAFRNAGVPEGYKDQLDQQIQFANIAENQISRWQTDLPNAIDRVEGSRH